MAVPATNGVAHEASSRPLPSGAMPSVVFVRSPGSVIDPPSTTLHSVAIDIASVERRGGWLNDRAVATAHVVLLEYAGAHDVDLVQVCSDLSGVAQGRIIVVSSAWPDQDLQIAALDAGADDFVEATVSAAVLEARIRAALRSQQIVPRATRIAVGDVSIDLDERALFIAGQPVRCPPLHFSLLVTLASAPNHVVERRTLWSMVWGRPAELPDGRRIRIAISALRGVLGVAPGRPRIDTVGSVGYRLVCDDGDGHAA